jgi:uncharacterized protein (DUF1330 family)
MPAAYLMVQTQIDDEAGFLPYKERAPELIRRHGGEYLVRGGRFRTLEGTEPLPRVVLIRFPDFEAGMRWYTSPEYQDMIRIRNACGRANLILAEGLPDGSRF